MVLVIARGCIAPESWAMPDGVRHLGGVNVFENERLRLVRERYATPDGEQERAIIYHPGAVVILAAPEPGKILMVRQYRYALQRETLEVPAGTIDAGEDPASSAARELVEETGYQAAQLHEISRIYPSVGLSDEIQYFYRAEGLSPATMNPDDGELIAPEILDQAAVDQAIASGLICDAKTLLAIQILGLSWQAMVSDA